MDCVDLPSLAFLRQSRDFPKKISRMGELELESKILSDEGHRMIKSTGGVL